jgi:hypothetical protein
LAYSCWNATGKFNGGCHKDVRAADVVHVHSNWTFPVWWGAWLALRYQKTLVMSPHGLKKF